MPTEMPRRPAVYMEASGYKVDLDVEDHFYQIDLRDIIRSAARIPRYNTQTCRRYTIGEHQLMVEKILREEYHAAPIICLQGLIHDATETYIGDIPAPVKWLCPDIAALEDRLWRRVATVFTVPEKMSELVKHVDQLALFLEARSLCTSSVLSEWSNFEKYRVELENLWPKYQIRRGPLGRLWSATPVVEARYGRRLLSLINEVRDMSWGRITSPHSHY